VGKGNVASTSNAAQTDRRVEFREASRFTPSGAPPDSSEVVALEGKSVVVRASSSTLPEQVSISIDLKREARIATASELSSRLRSR
jgi:hypothetical protein